MRTLPPFPVDDRTLEMLSVAVNPWAHDVQAECSSLGSFLEFMSQLGGADTSAVTGEQDGVTELRDPQYSPNDVIEALVSEIQRQREEDDEDDEEPGKLKVEISWHPSFLDALLIGLIAIGVITTLVGS